MISKSMSIYMPVLMGFMAYSLASGLAIYFFASNVFGIIQYAILGRANWSNLLPFLKEKDGSKNTNTKIQPEVVDAKVEEVAEPEAVEEPDEKHQSEKRTLPKRKRPKRKKNK